MTVKTEYEKRIVISAEMLVLLAKDAFYGSNEQLADKIKNALSYEEGGRTHPANGFSLSDALAAVKAMDADEVLKCVERTTVRLMHDDGDGSETELLHGDETSISMIYWNITGRNFEDEPETEYTNYLARVKNNLPYPALDATKVFIAVK